MTPYAIIATGDSSSFPPGDAFLAAASADGSVLILLGAPHYVPDPARTAILVELGLECLGTHTGEGNGDEGSNTVGFARYRNGDDPPSQLIELVHQPRTAPAAIAAAKAVFEAAGFTVVSCSDGAGRIIDRLVRPKYNVALRFLDEGLATAADMDLTCRMGLGYPTARSSASSVATSRAIVTSPARCSMSTARQPTRRPAGLSSRRPGGIDETARGHARP